MTHPHHAVLLTLLVQNQFESCRVVADALLAQQMSLPQPDDQELARLHVILCRAFVGLQEHKAATEKADIAVFLARKLKDDGLTEEALYRAGGCYIRMGEYRTAIQRLSECLQCISTAFRAETLYNRGLAYDSQGAYSYAVADYEAALQIACIDKPQAARACRINLAWVLLRLQDFARADQLLKELADQPGAETDQALQLQLAHDRIHMAYLQREFRDSFRQALAALRQAGSTYPHVRAHILLTLMSLAADGGMPKQAFLFGVLAKRLAGQARRPDIDEKASREMQNMEYQVGTEHLVQALRQLRQVTSGAMQFHNFARGANGAGGV